MNGMAPRMVIEDHVEPWCSHLLWTGPVNRAGYGMAFGQHAHRLFYEKYVGPIPEGWHVDHLCRNKLCVKLDHLEAVTPAENTRRGLEARQVGRYATHCKHGHQFTRANSYMNTSGSRECRACRQAAQVRKRANRSAAGLATATGKPRRSVRGRPRRVA